MVKKWKAIVSLWRMNEIVYPQGYTKANNGGTGLMESK